MQTERRDAPPADAQVRVASVGGKRKIIGYGAVFNRLSSPIKERGRSFVERIMPGAFDDCLGRCDVRGMVNHNVDMLLGRTKSGTMRLTTDAVGLRYEIDAPDTEVGRDTVTMIERGDLDGSSFSFNVAEGGDSWDNSKEPMVRTVRVVRDLFDLGPVCFAAYPDATTGVRSRGRSTCTEQEWFAKVHGAFQRGLIDARTVVALRHQWREMQKNREANQGRIRIMKLKLGRPLTV